ncbi:MAG TPA: hypothetical protein VFT72_19515 [Opitutaceae bacterium]|nr:hypothetical protein [Opitutaceae bacterium]
MSSLPSKAFVHVEIVDFSKEPLLLQETAKYYCSLSPDRRDWPEEKLRRLAIRTECKWGRIPIGEDIYMVSEFGDGPRAPLSATTTASVKFFAELRPSAPGKDDGYIESKPFCQVQFNEQSCRQLRTQGLVKLEEFIRRTVPECAQAFEEWRALLQTAKARYVEIKEAKAAKVSATAGARITASSAEKR